MVNLQAIGHLGKDATVNEVNGKTVINFSVAHSEKYKNAEGVEVSKTLWIECSQWTDRTSLVPYLKKGTQVYVAGIPSVDSYKNADGITIAKMRLRIANINLLGSGKKDDPATEAPAMPSTPSQTETTGEAHDDLPF